MSKEHANHNAELCDLLLNNGNFNDWVVTTAFYAALHFSLAHIFPLEEDGESFQSVDAYKQVKKLSISKHAITKNLVKKKIREVSANYNWLWDACYTARYKNYLVDKAKAEKAVSFLNLIKSAIKNDQD